MGKSAARVIRPVPPLRDGDRLTRPEFERRYDATPGVRKAELVNGVVYVESDRTHAEGLPMPPVGNEGHADPHFDLVGWLAIYRMTTPGVAGSDNPSLRLPSVRNMPQPDALLRILPAHGGRSAGDPDDILAGVPELVAEVAASSAPLDLGPKLEAYQNDGVREYIVWRPRVRALDWFRLNRRGRFVPLVPGEGGILRSRVFPGLWLDPEALTGGNAGRVLAVAQQGIASPGHAAFVEKLRRAAARKKR